MTGDDDESGSKLGYNFIYGFQKPMGSIGTYWGMEFGLSSWLGDTLKMITKSAK